MITLDGVDYYDECLQFPGEAVQVDPIKPTLKAPEYKRSILKHDQLVSNLGSNSNLRRYTQGG